MKIVQLVFYILFITSYSNTQENKTLVHAFNLEVLGIGYYGSVNYEIQFNRYSGLKPILQIGISANRLNNANHQFDPELIFPISFGALVGKTHQLELGVGTNLIRQTQSIFTHQTHSFSSVFTSNIGYRFSYKKIALSVNLYYFLNKNYTLQKFWPGFGFIYQFPTK